MRHVLEHLHEPVNALKLTRSVLNKEGILYVAVPDLLEYKSFNINKFFRAVHVLYFNKKNLQAFLSSLGFKTAIIKNKSKKNPYEIYTICQKSKIGNFELMISDEDLVFINKLKWQILLNRYLPKLIFRIVNIK